MITPNEEHSQRTLAADFKVAKDLHLLCSQSAECLSCLSELAVDPQLAQHLEGIAAARRKIAKQLLDRPPADDAERCSGKIAEIASSYQLICGSATDVTDELLLEIAEVDQLALKELRREFKEVVNISLACSLSSSLASFQISSDKLASSLKGV